MHNLLIGKHVPVFSDVCDPAVHHVLHYSIVSDGRGVSGGGVGGGGGGRGGGGRFTISL